MELKISQIGTPNHSYSILKKQQIRGAEREAMALSVCADGVSNVQNKIVAQNRITEQSNYIINRQKN